MTKKKSFIRKHMGEIVFWSIVLAIGLVFYADHTVAKDKKEFCISKGYSNFEEGPWASFEFRCGALECHNDSSGLGKQCSVRYSGYLTYIGHEVKE
jgi:hypothetical protein